MNNSEKFKEIFGYKPDNKECVAPKRVCKDHNGCILCPFHNWWSKEYRGCFEMKEE